MTMADYDCFDATTPNFHYSKSIITVVDNSNNEDTTSVSSSLQQILRHEEPSLNIDFSSSICLLIQSKFRKITLTVHE